MNSSKIWILIVAILIFTCLCVCVCLAAVGVFSYQLIEPTIESTELEPVLPLPTPAVTLPQDPTHAFPIPAVPDPPQLPSALDAAYQTLERLKLAEVPVNDPRNLGQRLRGIQNIPETVPFPGQFQVGARRQFWVSDLDTNENFQVEAVLRYVTDSAYFWIEDGVHYNGNHLARLANTFNDQIYPTTREFFGSEWSPGIDNDPRLYILYVSGVGSGIAGYFSSADSVHTLAHPYSNSHEMFIISADNTVLNEDFTFGVLAHEFQHMIHWYRDRNEETWLNEGFSELAAFLNGYDPGGFDYIFSLNPDIQLNDWPNDSNLTTPHYGAAFLFVNYFLDRFGEEATQALVAHPDNGLVSVDAVLADLNAVDPLSGAPIRADDLFADWTVTNFLNDPSAADGRFHYSLYDSAPIFTPTETIRTCDGRWLEHNVSQYGTHYFRLDCPSTFTLEFQGTSEVPLLPIGAYSGDYAFWSNKGDESNMTLTQTFDFTATEGPLTLSYRTWYDLEKDYDYLYLVASEDGLNWQILTTPSCTTIDPSGNSFGCGYNGITDGYLNERVDISQFAGKKVHLRFEYVTDAAVHGEGLLLDDIEIPEIGYFSDFEEDDGGWEGSGFVRIQNRLPQTFRLSLIRSGQTTTVENLSLDEDQTMNLILEKQPGETITLVVSATTRFTRQQALYRISLTP